MTRPLIRRRPLLGAPFLCQDDFGIPCYDRGELEPSEGRVVMEVRLEESRVVLDLHPRVAAWFSTRRGGVSRPPFDTLNLSYGVGDDADNVQANRARILSAEGRRLSELVMAHQVHHNHLEWIDRSQAGRGALGKDPIAATDGFLTDDPDVVLGLGFADCVPLYLTDVNARYLAILHAGWRGTAAQIQRIAVETLGSRGVSASEILVGIGPAIGPCCYEVDAPVYDAISRVVGTAPLAAKDSAHWWLDLKKANRLLLEEAGVNPDHIVEAPYCTGCRPDLFFSYRIQGRRTGRMGGFICWKRP